MKDKSCDRILTDFYKPMKQKLIVYLFYLFYCIIKELNNIVHAFFKGRSFFHHKLLTISLKQLHNIRQRVF